MGLRSEAFLLQEQLTVFNTDILMVVFGIYSGGWIVGTLPVVVNHPVLQKGLGLVVRKHVLDVRKAAKVVGEAVGVDRVCVFQSLAAGTIGLCGAGGDEEQEQKGGDEEVHIGLW